MPSLGDSLLDDDELRNRFLDQIRAGLGKTGAARAVGIDYRTLLRYIKRNPDFNDDIEAALDDSVEPVMQMLREEAIAGDVTAAREFLKYRAPRPRQDEGKEKTEVKHKYEIDPGTIDSIEALRQRLEGRALPAIETTLTDD